MIYTLSKVEEKIYIMGFAQDLKIHYCLNDDYDSQNSNQDAPNSIVQSTGISFLGGLYLDKLNIIVYSTHHENNDR